MTNLILTVMAQARHARAVHSCICELLMVAMPDLVKGSRFIRNSTEFCERIDCAIRDASTPKATADDYIRAIVNASCDEMATVCRLLKSASALAGLERIAADYLDGQRFREMLLRKDSEKLERIVAIVKAREGKPIKVLMDVAAELNDKAERYDEISPAAKRKATADMKKIIAKVDEIRSSMDEHRDEIVARVDDVGGKVAAVGKKVDRLRLRGERKSKYGDNARNTCLMYWEMAQENAEVRHAINTRVTYESVFTYFKGKLVAAGINTVKKFKAVLHATKNLEYARRVKALEAKREAGRKAKKNNPHPSPLTPLHDLHVLHGQTIHPPQTPHLSPQKKQNVVKSMA